MVQRFKFSDKYVERSAGENRTALINHVQEILGEERCAEIIAHVWELIKSDPDTQAKIRDAEERGESYGKEEAADGILYSVGEYIYQARRILGDASDAYTDEEILAIPESILADVTHRGFLKNEIQGPLQERREYVLEFPEESFRNFILDDTMWRTYLKRSQGNDEKVAIITTDRDDVGNIQYNTHTHGQFKTIVNDFAAGMLEEGITEDDEVALLTMNTMEEAASIMALNAIGATAKMVDYTKGIAATIESLKSATKLRSLVIDERLLFMSENKIETTSTEDGGSAEKTTVISLKEEIDKLGLPVTILRDTGKFKGDKYTTFEKVSELGKGKTFEPAKYNPNRIALIITSSGTTGLPKPICHTDRTVNNSVPLHNIANYLFGECAMVKAIPGFIGLGTITTMYTGLLTGSPLVMVEGQELPKDCAETLIHYPEIRDNSGLPSDMKVILFASPIFVRELCQTIEGTDIDLSHISAIMVAGSAVDAKDQIILEKKLHEHGYEGPIRGGYGQNENGGFVTEGLGTNSMGLAGKPLIGRRIYIVNPETKEVISNPTFNVTIRLNDEVDENGDYLSEYVIDSQNVKISHDCVNGKVTVSGAKFWPDRNADDEEIVVPENVVINLYMNGELISSAPANKDNNYAYEFSSLENHILKRMGTVYTETPTLFEYYEGLPEKTEEAKKYLLNGVIYDEPVPGAVIVFDTRDIGVIYPDGNLSMTRPDDVLTREDFKLPIHQIERKMRGTSVVKDCTISPLTDENNPSVEIAVAFITLPDDSIDSNMALDALKEEIEMGRTELRRNDCPDYIVVLPTIPIMPNGKVNRRELVEYATLIAEANNEKIKRKITAPVSTASETANPNEDNSIQEKPQDSNIPQTMSVKKMDVASVLSLPVVRIERNHLDEKATEHGADTVQDKAKQPKQIVKK